MCSRKGGRQRTEKGFGCQVSDKPLNTESASLIEGETSLRPEKVERYCGSGF
jgi:hypothetical protein